jgi:hypothetical protein
MNRLIEPALPKSFLTATNESECNGVLACLTGD